MQIDLCCASQNGHCCYATNGGITVEICGTDCIATFSQPADTEHPSLVINQYWSPAAWKPLLRTLSGRVASPRRVVWLISMWIYRCADMFKHTYQIWYVCECHTIPHAYFQWWEGFVACCRQPNVPKHTGNGDDAPHTNLHWNEVGYFTQLLELSDPLA